jgi:hypothetical protein
VTGRVAPLGAVGSAARRGPLATAVGVLGLLVGFAALEHGLGELLQGPVPPSSLAIESWPDAQAFEIVSGEPAMTVIPNLAVAGAVTMVLACAFAAWARGASSRPMGALGLVLLSALLLLAGGGIAPPVIGIILAAAIAWPRRPSTGADLTAFARAWRPLLTVTVAAYLALVPGLVVLSAIVTVDLTPLAVVLPLVAFASLVTTLLAARQAEAAAAR